MTTSHSLPQLTRGNMMVSTDSFKSMMQRDIYFVKYGPIWSKMDIKENKATL